MPNYKAMYFALAAQVANAIDLLIKAQQEGEESAIKEGDTPDTEHPADNVALV
ncbi:MAG: hypothetical protein VB078_11785 [Clostridiaceae bacterium]|nr:hypothetical protein [Clostridiaceae bacterium]